MQKHFSIHVSGKVQGVFFRASTQEKANELSIKGFVRNERDGSVFIEAEGEEDQLRSFIEWCRQGPRMAQVTSCKIEEGPLQHYPSFTIQR